MVSKIDLTPRAHRTFCLQMELLPQLKKQQFVSVIWTCSSSIFWKNHTRFFRLVKCAKKTVTLMNGTQVQPSYLIKNGRTSIGQLAPTGGPRRASNRTPDQSSGRPEAGASCGRSWTARGDRITRVSWTILWRIDKDIIKFDRRLSSWCGPPFAKYADALKLEGRHAKTNLSIGRTELRLPRNFGTW